MESDVISGQKAAWVLLKKLGEGDAGEVFLVESLLEKQPAILKRPGRSAFASDVIRQSSQITTEGKILKALFSAIAIDGDFPVSVPELIDQSRPGTAFSERMFIIIEKAPGFDLAQLARTARFGMNSGTEPLVETPEEKRFLQLLSERGKAPERVLLQALNGLLGLFEKIHQRHFNIEGIDYGGILWNDVKPEHLFWDPWRARLTVIDWGNGQLLEQDGATRDRRYSATDDYRQWLDELGRFLEASAPSLYEQLEWPGRVNPGETDPQAITSLQERIGEALQSQMIALAKVRDCEVNLLSGGTVEPEPRRRGVSKTPSGSLLSGTPLAGLVSLHHEIIGFGEIPNYDKALSLALSWAARFAASGQMLEVEEICGWAENLPGSDGEHLRLVTRLAHITQQADTQGATRAQHNCLSETVQSALRRDWPGVLWGLISALHGAPEPDWWYDLVSEVRRQELGQEDGDRQPLLVGRRGLLTLQAMAERMERPGSAVNPDSLERLQALVRHLREEILPNWAHIDPGPPHANLTYLEIDGILEEIQAFSPEIRQALDRALDPARAQVRTVLDFWEKGQFGQAIEGLRQVLLWDPDRRRVLKAEQALLQAPAWLEKVQRGPTGGEHYLTFIAEIEFEGRELRGQVGPAGWIDLILEGCRQLRHGAWPADLFTGLPMLVKEMPWLRRFERVERLPAGVKEAEPADPFAFVPLHGTAKGKLGREGDMQMGAPLDAWIGEARGSSARVFSGMLRDAAGNPIPAAIKLMRMDKIDYSLPLFREEVIVLNAMRGVPGITPLLECGFINLEDGATLPTGRDESPDPRLGGGLIRIGPAIGQEFVLQIERRADEGWIPYLAIQQRDSSDNLLVLCDAGMTRGQYRSAADLLLMSIQICEILHEAHRRNIVYRDHKILHYYWLEPARGIYMIDWNVAKLYPNGLSDYEKQMDLVQFGARALHHILTGRTAPGALPLGPTRPDEIEQAAKSYQAQWTYDDLRLPEDVREILERVLAGDYNNAVQLRDDLKQSFLNLPEW